MYMEGVIIKKNTKKKILAINKAGRAVGYYESCATAARVLGINTRRHVWQALTKGFASGGYYFIDMSEIEETAEQVMQAWNLFIGSPWFPVYDVMPNVRKAVEARRVAINKK